MVDTKLMMVKSSRIKLNEEPEGLTVYNGELYLTLDNGSGILYYLKNYLEENIF